MAIELDTAPAVVSSAAAAAAGAHAPAVRQRRGWLFRRMYYSPMEEAEQGTAPPADEEEEYKKPGGTARAQRGWLRRLVPRQHALGRRRRKLMSGAPARLAAGLRWKRVCVVGGFGGGGCASALFHTVAFRVMYVVEAVVLGLALSCFFCCCGCQI